MEIKARVALKLPNEYYKVILKYDTFEKATYDSYLIASLVANTKKEDEAIKYIDEITGKGSLNPHFKKLYEKISKFTEEQIDNILKNSLFPVTIINTKNHFEYYKMFNATKMNGKIYPYNLADDPNLKDIIMPKGDNIKFLSIDFEKSEGNIIQNVYNAIFTETEIKVDLGRGKYYPISKENFEFVYKNDLDDISKYRGKIGTQISLENWNALNNQVLQTICNENRFYIDENGNQCIVYNDCVKEIEVINVFSMYFYKETRYGFTLKNNKICEEVINYLLSSKNINEFKTKSLINILDAVSDNTKQKVVNYILCRKDSKEIAEVGLEVITSGLEKGWDQEALESMKSFSPKDKIKLIYKINSYLDFSIEEILCIDDCDLLEVHKILKKKHMDERKNVIDEMNRIIGEIINSGVREKMKSLKNKDNSYIELKNFINKDIAHLKQDYGKLSLKELKNKYNKIYSIYTGPFENIKKMIDDQMEIG